MILYLLIIMVFISDPINRNTCPAIHIYKNTFAKLKSFNRKDKDHFFKNLLDFIVFYKKYYSIYNGFQIEYII